MNKNYHVDLKTLIDVVSTIPSNIFLKDTDLKYVFSSHIWEQIESQSDENFDIYGKTDRDVRKDKSNLDKAEQADRRILETGIGQRYTIKAEVDGHTQILDITKEPVRDDDGNIIGIVGIINDVSLVADELRRQFEENLKEAEHLAQMKTDFLANISHEIRTPLNAILGMNDLILREYEDKNLIEYATSIKESGNVLLGLINELLDFSSIVNEKIEIIKANYKFNDFIRDIINPVKLNAYKKLLSFNVEIDDNIPIELYGDAKRVTQVLNNLLSNAVKYTEKGTVTLKATLVESNDEKCKIKYEVIDTGIGIKEEDIKNLKLSFTRLEEQRNKQIEGVGLGIAISDYLLKHMGSDLDIKSEYGKGSNFSFVLEQKIIDNTTFREFKEKQNEAELRGDAFVAPDAEVLVVDDVLINLKVAEGLLGKLNMHIDTALSGAEAIEKCKDKHYNLVFMDYMMPEMNGTEAMNHIKDEIDGYENVPFIALTADTVTEAKQVLIEQGFSDFVSKPIDVQYITGIIRKWLPGELICIDPVEEKETDELGDDDTTFDDSLKKFYDSIEQNAVIYRELLYNNELDKFKKEMHELSHIAKKITAENLAEKAKELEDLCNNSYIEVVKENYDTFERYYLGFKEKVEMIMMRRNNRKL